MYTMSKRKSTLIITPSPTIYFVYKSAVLWNLVNNIVVANQNDFAMKICTFKTAVKKFLLLRQSAHEANDWCPKNYDIHQKS